MHLIRKTFSELVTDLSSFFGQGPRTTDSSVGATITEGSSTREGGVTEEPPELQQQLQEKQRISKSGKLFEFNVSQTNRGKYSCRGENETFPSQLGKVKWVLETVKGLKLEFIQIPLVQTKLSNCHITSKEKSQKVRE